MTDDTRTNRAEPIANALSALRVPGLTDEQWAERDAAVASARAASDERERKQQESHHRTALIKAGFPRRAIDWAVRADETTDAIRRVTQWQPAKESTLVLSGTKGCGKTVAATWWAMQQRPVPSFVRATTFAASSRYDREERTTWLAAPALVLDDLGTEYLDGKGSFLVDLDELLDVFYSDYKPLLITTNCTLAEFSARVGARITDRLRECGAFESINGVSMRRTGA